jgi:hypothetical protein
MIRKPPPGWETQMAPCVPAAPLGRATAAAISTGMTGLKRTYSLVRAAYLGFMALILGCGALSAGLVGHNPIVMMGAGSFSLLAGWWAMRIWQRAMGEGPTARQAFATDGTAAAEIAAMLHSQTANLGAAGGQATMQGRGFGRKAAYATAPDESAGPEMTQAVFGRGDGQREAPPAPQLGRAATAGVASRGYVYSQPKMLWHLVRCAAGVAVILYAAGHNRNNSGVSLLLLAVAGMCGWYIAMVATKSLSNNLTAIAWDERQVSIHALHATHQVFWPAVVSCEAQRRTVRMLGIIPVATTRKLTLVLDQNGRRKRVSVMLNLTDMSDDAVRLFAARVTAHRAQHV